MANDWKGPQYNLDDVANPVTDFAEAPIPYDKNKGDCSMDGVESIESDSSLTHKTDYSYPPGKPVELRAVTDVEGMASQTDYAGGTGTVAGWPRAWEDK